MAIYVTGDTHFNIDIDKLNTDNWPYQRELTKNDYLIILGDWGVFWDTDGMTKGEKYFLNWYNEKKFTTLIILGNHDCYPRYDKYADIDWNGGKVKQIADSVYVLGRGEYFTIDGTTLWTMSGARCHDIRDGVLDLSKPEDLEKYKRWKNDMFMQFRVLNKSWWPQEMPSESEFARGKETLAAHENKVDYILTHDCPSSTNILMGNHEKPDELKIYFEEIRQSIDFKRWYFGHHHMDRAITDKEICVYDKIIQIA